MESAVDTGSFALPEQRERSIPGRRERRGWRERDGDGGSGDGNRIVHAARTLSPAFIACALFAMVLVSAVLRSRQLHFHYWVDEAISVGIASHPLSALPRLLKQDGSPPLYYFVLHFWIAAFGSGEVATHVLSLLFALIAIPVAYWAGVAIDKRVGLCSALLTAGVPFLTMYAQETRMYSLMVLLSLLVCATFLRGFVYRRRRYVPAFAAALAATVYTHDWGVYLAAAGVVAVVLCALTAEPAGRRRILTDGALAYLAVLVLYAPWLPTAIFQARHTGAPWAIAPVLWSLTQGTYFVVGDRSEAVALLLGGGAGMLAIHRVTAPGDRLRTALYALLVLAFLTFFIAWLDAKLNPSWAPRYEAAIVGPLAVLFGLGVSRAGRLGVAVLVLCWALWITTPRAHSVYTKSNVAAVAHEERTVLGRTSLVLSTQPEQVPTLAFYMPQVRRFATPVDGLVSDPTVVDWVNALALLERSTPRRVLAPVLRTVAPGTAVALVVPLGLPHQSHYLWLVDHTSHTWLHVLLHDPRLRFVRATQAQAQHATSPVRLYLFRAVS